MLKVGDVVTSRTDTTQKGVVEKLESFLFLGDLLEYAVVSWFDSEDKLHRKVFDQSSLTLDTPTTG